VNLAIRRSLADVSLAQLAGIDAAPVRLPALEHEIRARVGGSRAVPRPAAAARTGGSRP
jgi:hypothetical protein